MQGADDFRVLLLENGIALFFKFRDLDLAVLRQLSGQPKPRPARLVDCDHPLRLSCQPHGPGTIVIDGRHQRLGSRLD